MSRGRRRVAEIRPEHGCLGLFRRANHAVHCSEFFGLVYVGGVVSTPQCREAMRNEGLDVWQAKRLDKPPMRIKRGTKQWGRSPPLAWGVAREVWDLRGGAIRVARANGQQSN